MSPDIRPSSVLVVRRTGPCSMPVIACGVPRRVLQGLSQESCQVFRTACLLRCSDPAPGLELQPR